MPAWLTLDALWIVFGVLGIAIVGSAVVQWFGHRPSAQGEDE